MSSESYITVTINEGWAEILLDRPERRNSFIPPMADEITAALQALASDDIVACVVLRGAGGFFCSGIDLKALQADPPPPWAGKQGHNYRAMHLAFYRFPKPIICAFEKYGINAGASLAMACDLIIAGEGAFLQIGEIQQGSGIPMNAAWLKIKSSEQVLARLAFYGDRVNSTQLLNMGLISEIVADDMVVETCHALATRIASFPSGAPATIKSSIVSQRNIVDPEDWFPKQSSNALLSAKQIKN